MTEREIMIPERLPVQAGIDVLKSAAENGTFTAVIGAACSSLDYPDEPRAEMINDIRAKARAIAAKLEQDEAEYLSELIDCARLSGLTADVPEPLLRFYVAIVRLDRRAALTFKKGVDLYTDDDLGKKFQFAWRMRPKTFLSLPRLTADWHVPLEMSELHEQLVESLNTAIEAADDLRRAKGNEKWVKQGLGADGIAANLRAFHSAIMDGRRVRRGAALTLMDLVWIGNLFWHSLRFDLPYYPTTAELAFQISLYKVPPETTVRTTPALAQAAQAIIDPLRHLTNWFRLYTEERRSSPFYAALAAWLHHTYLRFDEPRQRSLAPRIPAPLVFTTNYDREIEEALKAERCAHHLVIPIQFVTRKKDKQYEPVMDETPLWLMKTVRYGKDNSETYSWHYAGTTNDETPLSNLDDADQYKPTRKYIGPIVVKLHGSPLEDLPEPEPDLVHDLPNEQQSRLGQSAKFSVEYRHRVIISESDYLADLRRDLPRWLRDRLQTGDRTLFFLGQSIADWNIRLRLADHAAWSDNLEGAKEAIGRPPRGGPNRFAVNRSLSGFDVAFMGPLGIAYVPAELQQVREVLENVVLELLAPEAAR